MSRNIEMKDSSEEVSRESARFGVAQQDVYG
jgi:hypothetical protein